MKSKTVCSYLQLQRPSDGNSTRTYIDVLKRQIVSKRQIGKQHRSKVQRMIPVHSPRCQRTAELVVPPVVGVGEAARTRRPGPIFRRRCSIKQISLLVSVIPGRRPSTNEVTCRRVERSLRDSCVVPSCLAFAFNHRIRN
jgi:hypothetical protein